MDSEQSQTLPKEVARQQRQTLVWSFQIWTFKCLVVEVLSLKVFSGFIPLKLLHQDSPLGMEHHNIRLVGIPNKSQTAPVWHIVTTTTSNLPGNHGTSGPRAGRNCSSESAQGRESYWASYLRKWMATAYYFATFIRVMLMSYQRSRMVVSLSGSERGFMRRTFPGWWTTKTI